MGKFLFYRAIVEKCYILMLFLYNMYMPWIQLRIFLSNNTFNFILHWRVNIRVDKFTDWCIKIWFRSIFTCHIKWKFLHFVKLSKRGKPKNKIYCHENVSMLIENRVTNIVDSFSIHVHYSSISRKENLGTVFDLPSMTKTTLCVHLPVRTGNNFHPDWKFHFSHFGHYLLGESSSCRPQTVLLGGQLFRA